MLNIQMREETGAEVAVGLEAANGSNPAVVRETEGTFGGIVAEEVGSDRCRLSCNGKFDL